MFTYKEGSFFSVLHGVAKASFVTFAGNAMLKFLIGRENGVFFRHSYILWAKINLEKVAYIKKMSDFCKVLDKYIFRSTPNQLIR